ncbi:MAG: tRNA (guanosine(46)-N7)-methyltransferase TrmB [Planctomycetota bacterium]
MADTSVRALHGGSKRQRPTTSIMVSRKRLKWARNQALPMVFQPPVRGLVDGDEFMRGAWHSEVFGNSRPITLELGCGEGTYAVELARKYPERNFVGVDIKGHRFWRGAQTAHDAGLTNVAFLRARVEFLDRCFGPDEVDELWLTFSDPRPKDERGTKRITSPLYFAFYQCFVREGGRAHVKSDSELLFETTRAGLAAEGYALPLESRDVHGELVTRCDPERAELLRVVTPYERRWIREGRAIHYLEVVLPPRRDPQRIDASLEALQGSRRSAAVRRELELEMARNGNQSASA